MGEVVHLASYRAGRSSRLTSSCARSQNSGIADRRQRFRGVHEDRRSEQRHLVSGDLRMTVLLGTKSAISKNVSPNGLMACAALEVGPGARLLVNVPGCMALSGRVVWMRQGMVGLHVPVGSLQMHPA